MGGRFDPVHLAHSQTALQVCRQFAIDILHLVPTYNPPHRDAAIASFKQRCAMLNIAATNIKQAGLSIIVDEIESQIKNKSYTYLTIKKMQKNHPNDKLFVMMGSDAFLKFDTWYNYEQLLKLCDLIVDQRPGDSINEINEKKAHLLKTVPNAKIHFCEVPQMAISSSQIRNQLKQGVDDLAMLDANVLCYIKNQKCYQ